LYQAGISTYVPVTAGAAQRLMVLAPGEQIEEGNSALSGKKAGFTPTTQVAGSTFTVQVYATDVSYNIVTSAADTITLGTDDVFSDPTLPAPKALIGGSTTFGVYLVTAENKTTKISASAPGFTTGAPYQSQAISLSPAAADRYQILLPGEIAVPGSYAGAAKGRTGLPDVNNNNGDGIQNFVAGTALNVTVRAVDSYWNKTAAQPAGIELATTDPWDAPNPQPVSLLNGATNFLWTFRTATTTGWVLTVDDGLGGFSADVSTPVKVDPGVPITLQVLVPGELPVPGSASGKTGSASAWTAGISSAVTVSVVDAQWNVVPTASIVVQGRSDTDPFDLPATMDQSLVSGTTQFRFTLVTATASATVTVIGFSTSTCSPAARQSRAMR
jgi:hypothetical protein